MPSRFVSWLKNSRNTGAFYGFFLPAAFLLCLALLLSTIFVGKDNREKSVKWGIDVIRGGRGSRSPKITSEASPQPSKVQPRRSSQPQPWPPAQSPTPHQPSIQPQPQPQPQPPPPPEHRPSSQPQPPTQQPSSQQPQPQPPTQPPPSLPPPPPPPEQKPLSPPQPQPQPPTHQQPTSPPPPPEHHPSSQPSTQQPPSLPPQLPPPPPPPPPLEQKPPSPQPQPQPPTQQQQSLQPQTETQVPPAPQLQPESPLHPSPQPQPPHGDQKGLAQYRPPGSEALPKGLAANTSDLQMQPLWGRRKKVNSTTSLFIAAVGIKQKETVDKMVRKFLSSNFSVMLFHYDGVVDAWKDLDWSDNVIHISAFNQTKWWFAKRFLHPAIVAAYSYIFLWDEDLGVDNFDPGRYLSIVKDEGLEISQPALDTQKSEVHHAITARWRNSTVHRRVKPSGKKNGCDWTSQYPPCTGWIELMAPVFSRAAWRCIWYMIQNDLNHAWGLDIMFGYCAQGDRTKNVGVVDAEYIVHYAFPTIGETQNKENSPNSSATSARIEVRKHSLNEYKIFKRRWKTAAKEDDEWVDPYPESWSYSIL